MTHVIPTGAQTVRAGVNERQFFSNMKNMFASSYAFLGELLQNARRAGASRVEVTLSAGLTTILVRDDGNGVQDWQSLITLAQSGWDEKTIQNERPFGMGLFSTLFAAKEVLIRSRGKRLRVTLEDVIEKHELEVQDDEFGGPGTIVELRGLSANMLAHEWRAYDDKLTISGSPESRQYVLVNECRNLAKGFAIPVVLNGEHLARPDAQAHLIGAHTEIGFVHLPGIHTGEAIIDYKSVADAATHYLRPRLYLQGLPIAGAAGPERVQSPVVHLETAQFSPKLPDRRYLVDPEQASKRIDAAINQVIRIWVETEKARLSQRDFVLHFWSLCSSKGWGDLINDVPFFPAGELQGNFPLRIDCEGWETSPHPGVLREGMGTHDALISREDIETGRVVVWTDVPTCIADGSAITALDIAVANTLGVYTPVIGHFPEDHWLLALVPSVLDMRYEVEPVNPGASADYTGTCDHARVTMTLVDAVKITVRHSENESLNKAILIEDSWVLAPCSFSYDAAGEVVASDDVVVYLPKVDTSHDHPVDAMCSYRDDEDYDEDWRERSQTLWEGIESTLRGAALATIVKTALVDCVHHRPLEAHMQQMVLVSGSRWRGHSGSDIYREWTATDVDADLIARIASALDSIDATLPTAQRLTQALAAVVKPGQVQN